MVPTTCSSSPSTRAITKPSPPPPPSLSRSRPQFPAPVFDDSYSISFTDVLKSMQGPLFPISNDERIERSNSPAHSKSKSKTHSQAKRRREADLFQSLVEYVEFDGEERRKRKGKAKALPRKSTDECAACCAATVSSHSPSSPISPTPSVSSSVSRTSSWLSFGSSGSSSSSSSSSSAWSISTASTELTTPSTSPLSPSALTGWFKPPTAVQSFASRRKSWMTPSLTIPSSPLATDPSASPQSAILRHSCRSRSRLLLVPPHECPLPLDLLSSTTTSKALLQPLSFDGNLRTRRTRSSSAGSAVKESAGMVVRRVSRFVELAKGFQNAYMNAALFSVCASYDTYEERRVEYEVAGGRSEGSRSSSSTVGGGKEDNGMGKKQLKPAGYRVSSGDVSVFLDPTLPSSASSNSTLDTDGDIGVLSSLSPIAPEPPVKYIPLTSPFPPTHPPRTVLPNPLPYTLVFKPIPRTARSPFRFYNTHTFTHTTFPQSTPSADDAAPTAAVTWRVRIVGNPVYLRLKALQNVVCRRGTTWDGRGRDSMLGGGRERVMGVAFEGVGRTRLVNSVEVDGTA
ncbi:hypothetical protein BDQ12DRAFT_677490 [Crucibulum laeve]|uniref:Uncharacterized protein n=1 Tax=Crucibulum laeve TaxID=68775 RepID=A0A5C3MLG8_9AGAR|nr:hypothetical protein BDQ12DRAFT_677490 [Crucibulum laeve]